MPLKETRRAEIAVLTHVFSFHVAACRFGAHKHGLRGAPYVFDRYNLCGCHLGIRYYLD
jgi:hypothetical protein